jgi:PAS domain S-box-containing protein
VISDLLITAAYYSIPLILIYFIRQRKDLPYPWLVAMFAGFIVACGTTHLLSAITIWIPLYWLDGGIKGLTAILSVATAVLMIWIVPRALSLPSSAELQVEIQQRKSAEEALRVANAELQKNAARTQLLLDSALDGIVSIDHDGNVIDWNNQAEHIFGYSAGQALGCELADLIVPPAYQERHRQALSQFRTADASNVIGTRLEITGLRADGSEFPIELTVSALEQKNGYVFSAFIRDITERRMAEEERQETFNRLQKIASQLPGVVFQFRLHADGSSSLPYASEVLRDIYRIDPKEVQDDAAKVFAVVHPDDLDGHLDSIQESARGLSPWRNEYRLKFADGMERWLFGNALPQREQDSSVLWHGFVTDITEHKQMEEKLRDSDAFNVSILDSLTSHIAVLDAQGVIVAVNNAWRRFAEENGLSESSHNMLGFNYLDACRNAVNHPYGDEAGAVQAGIAAVLAGRQETFHLEYPCHSPTEQRWFHMNVSPLQGSRRGVVVSHENITERKLMEEKLQENENKLNAILDNVEAYIYIKDKQSRYQYANRLTRQLFGRPLEAIIGKTDDKFFPNETAANIRENDCKVIESGEVITAEEIDATRHITYLAIKQPLRREDGSIYGLCGISTDITERKKAEEVAQAAAQYSRSLIEASLDPLVTISAEGKITDVNIATERVTGVNRDNLIGSDFADYFTDPDQARDGYQQVFSQGSVTDYPLAIRHVSGKVTDVLYNASVYRNGNGDVLGVFAAARDITERREREHQLGLFHSLFEITSDCVFMISPKQDFRFVFVNDAACRHYGVEREQLLQWRIPDWDPNFKTQADLEALWNEIKTRKGFLLETIHRVASGREVPVEVSGNYLLYKGEEYLAGYFHDITERKLMENELTRSNAELEQFAYAVSHDMRQPLRMVTSYLSLIENAMTGQLNEETQQFFDFAVNGAKRMDAMILSLLDYSRIGRKSEAKTRISSQASLDEALAFLNPELDACHGEINVTGDWPELFASRDELTRLLQNLVGNALKYHQENKPPQVHVHGTVSNSSLRVEVRDHGIGIEPNQMDRLFKVFSRLQARTRFEGTGVGLVEQE